MRSDGRCGENSNCGAAGRMGASLRRVPLLTGEEGANVAGGEKNGGATDAGRGTTAGGRDDAGG
ncbi:MAG: hypothetical protein WDO74_19670 [Pseudomonadota bacterium]